MIIASEDSRGIAGKSSVEYPLGDNDGARSNCSFGRTRILTNESRRGFAEK
jgi:hypothetical protein